MNDFEVDWSLFELDLEEYLKGIVPENDNLVSNLRHFFLCFSRHYPRYYANVVSSEEHFRTERELEELKGGKEVNHEH